MRDGRNNRDICTERQKELTVGKGGRRREQKRLKNEKIGQKEFHQKEINSALI